MVQSELVRLLGPFAMKRFNLDGTAYARVWLNEEIPARFEPDTTDTRTYRAPQREQSASELKRRATLELFRLTCGPSSYGLLGAEFQADSGDTLVVEIQATNRDGP